jgi:sterol desaturase/sphingolipid hydroxylase (fatty acid hydroxylase superfamily)
MAGRPIPDTGRSDRPAFDSAALTPHNGRVRDRPAAGRRDLTVLAIPFYFASMAVEYLWLRRRAGERGAKAAGYERRDTIASLGMGVGSLVVPLVLPRLLRPFTPGRGRLGKVVIGVTAGAAVITTGADAVVRRAGGAPDEGGGGGPPSPLPSVARRVASVGGVATVVAGGVALATVWAARMAPERIWRRRALPSLGTGPLALALAVAGWDFIYYWNHRFMHESRYMWAMHVVHHSSERYNLSTALRQPVADALATPLPYGALCLVGVSPELVKAARDLNLLYQYWIHTETIPALGPVDAVFNTPTHHRVHHGSNRPYLDRNHGSILIVWDRLFGTFEPEGEPVVYGLTTNIGTFNLGRIATHEYVEMLRDVAGATGWRERLSYVARGPGWAKQHKAELDAGAARTLDPAPVSARFIAAS